MIAKIAGIDDSVSRMLQSSILEMESVPFTAIHEVRSKLR